MTLERFTRAYDVSELVLDDDGRTVEGRMVPYNVVQHIRDVHGEYDEVITPVGMAPMFQGFRANPRAVRSVEFQLTHSENLERLIGCGEEMRDEPEGPYVRFRLYERDDINFVRSVLRESHDGLSIDYGCRVRRTRPDGVIEPLGIHVFAVAATPTPTYATARIMAMRERPEPPPPPTPALDTMLEQWGMAALRSSADEA